MLLNLHIGVQREGVYLSNLVLGKLENKMDFWPKFGKKWVRNTIKMENLIFFFGRVPCGNSLPHPPWKNFFGRPRTCQSNHLFIC